MTAATTLSAGLSLMSEHCSAATASHQPSRRPDIGGLERIELRSAKAGDHRRNDPIGDLAAEKPQRVQERSAVDRVGDSLPTDAE